MTLSKICPTIYLSLGAAACCASLSSARAQDFSVRDPPADEQDIVVTAQKREQSLREVPSSVAVITAENLAETGKDSFVDFVNTVPGLSVATTGPGYSTLVVRGITTGRVRQDEPQHKETVGLYFGDTPISANGFDPDLGLFDLERIEVLRGPQGTLYGSGSLGGTIRIVPNQPDPDALAARFEGTASATHHGGFDHVLRGMVNLPLAEQALAMRATAYRNRQSGYIDDLQTGRSNVNDARTQGGRIQVGARIGPRADANLMFLVHDLRTGALSEQFAPYTRGVRVFDGNTDNLKVYSGRLTFDLDRATIISATSYLDKRNVNRVSLEFLLGSQLGFDSASPLVDTTRISDFTQEFRIVSPSVGRLEYVVGLFYQHHQRDYWQSAQVPGLDAYVGVDATDLGTPAPDQPFYGTQFIDQNQFAGFGEITFELAEGVKATAGLRAFAFRERYETYSSGLFNGGADSSDGEVNESGINPKFGLAFQPDKDRLFYLVAGARLPPGWGQYHHSSRSMRCRSGPAGTGPSCGPLQIRQCLELRGGHSPCER